MLNLLFESPLAFLITIVSLLLAISIHELAHAFAADRLGDPTPRIQGRLTINPLVHLDLLGTALLVFVGFGWGKPVLFDPYNLTNPRRDSAIISFAGPLSNLILAGISALLFNLGLFQNIESILVYEVLLRFIYLNVLLAVFNLIPVHPLDGGKIFIGLLPENLANEWDKILNQYGMFILILLILPLFGGASLASKIISPTIQLIINLLLPHLGYI